MEMKEMKKKEFKIAFGHPRDPWRINIGYGFYPATEDDDFCYIYTYTLFTLDEKDPSLLLMADALEVSIKDLVAFLISAPRFVKYLEERACELTKIRECRECRKVLNGVVDPVTFPYILDYNPDRCLKCFNDKLKSETNLP